MTLHADDSHQISNLMQKQQIRKNFSTAISDVHISEQKSQ